VNKKKKARPLTPGRIARRLLAFYNNDPKRWTQGTDARTADGWPVYVRSPEAACFCANGAIGAILAESFDRFNPEYFSYWATVTVTLGKAVPGGHLQSWNDGCKDFNQFKKTLLKIARTP